MALMQLDVDEATNDLLKDAAKRNRRTKTQHVMWLLEQEAGNEYAQQQSDDNKTEIQK